MEEAELEERKHKLRKHGCVIGARRLVPPTLTIVMLVRPAACEKGVEDKE